MSHILITTGIYPPQIGGPAQYAKNLVEALERNGNKVELAKYGPVERFLPSGLRHVCFAIKILPQIWRANWCLALDTFSVGLPTVLAGRLLGCKVIIRTGGDFLWEQYVERTKRKVLLRDFYQTETENFSLKERLIFKLTRLTLRYASLVIFSTDWQRQIWTEPYRLDPKKTAIVENYYGPKHDSVEPSGKVFLCAGRNLKLKNFDILKSINVDVEIGQWPPEVFRDKLARCYAVLVPSLSEVSPNVILEAVCCNKPFILTRENGLQGRLGEVGIYIDPLDQKDIQGKVDWLLDKGNYISAKRKVEGFNFTHTWDEIAVEFVELAKML